MGPRLGPGAAPFVGQGGSYGGSGGRQACNNSYFVNIDTQASGFKMIFRSTVIFICFQLGSVDIVPDVGVSATNNPTYGSGGGLLGGRGGGRIILEAATGNVFISGGGRVSAAGGAPPVYATNGVSVSAYGGGSGGAVVVTANNFTNLGLISVAGGPSYYQLGGAGGGGRISVNVSSILFEL